MKRQKTFSLTKEEAQKASKWIVVDATNVPVGRLASQVASLIRGKHKPSFTPNQNCGDFVIVTNSALVKLSGRKLDQKYYHRHSGYVGGLKSIVAREMLERHPDRVIRLAVRGMLPKGALGHQMLKRLKVVVGSEHPHEAQQPVEWSFDSKLNLAPAVSA